jgi:hypothetical protein
VAAGARTAVGVARFEAGWASALAGATAVISNAARPRVRGLASVTATDGARYGVPSGSSVFGFGSVAPLVTFSLL